MPKGSVKIMLSYDYCHFEVCLSSDEEMTLKQIDDMRKDAQRLADRAVKQYQTAKEKMSEKLSNRYKFSPSEQKQFMDILEKIPESERTPEQKGQVKAYLDWQWQQEHDYDYQDEEDET